MPDYIAYNEAWVTEDIARAIPATYGPTDTSIGRVVDERLVGGVLYRDFTQESIRASVVGLSPRWLSHELLWAIFAYPFHFLKVERIFSQIHERNEAALRFNARLGFREITRVAGVYPGPSGVVVTCLERADCRWLHLQTRRRDGGPK